MKLTSNTIKNFLKENILWIITFIILLVIIPFVIQNFGDGVKVFDSFVYNQLYKIMNPNLTSVMRVITQFGGPVIIITICACLLLLGTKMNYAFLVVASTAAAFLVNTVMKHIVQRSRPEVLKLAYETGYSFPSAHAMGSMALYGYIIYLVHVHIENKLLKAFLNIILVSLVILIGISRVYLGVHYASDVIYGFTVSFVILVVFIHTTKKYAK